MITNGVVVPKLSGYYGLISRNNLYSTKLDPSIDQNIVDAVFWYYHFEIRYTEEIFHTARMKIEKALQQNPNYALAWALLAQLYIDGESMGYHSVSDPLQEANKCIENALQLDHDCQHAYACLTWMYIFTREKDKAVISLEHCISINPRSSFFLAGACFFYSVLGEYDKSMEFFKQSIVLNPYYPWWLNLGPIFTHFYLTNYEEALEFANRVNVPDVFWKDIFKIAALGQLDRMEELPEMVSTFQIQFPGKAPEACAVLQQILFHESIHDRIKEGLHKAGLPV
jgi:adenylate cyclase